MTELKLTEILPLKSCITAQNTHVTLTAEAELIRSETLLQPFSISFYPATEVTVTNYSKFAF